MGDLRLTVALLPDFVVDICMRNQGDGAVRVAGLNLHNLSVWHAGSGIVPKPAIHFFGGVPNSGDIFTLGPGESKMFQESLLRHLIFPSAGRYTLRVFYSARHYQERFKANAIDALRRLSELDAIDAVSNEVDFELSPADWKHNVQMARGEARRFLGDC